MSPANLESSNRFKQHFDKILLVLTLIALLASAVYLLLDISGEKSAIDTGAWQAGISRQIPAEPLDVSMLSSNRNAILHPFRSLESMTNRLLISEQRVTCVNPDCQRPIDFYALTCPWCKAKQPPVTAMKDRDQDQIPDDDEVALGLDPNDPNDARADFDGDGFSNIEEYSAGTDLKDPKSIPPIFVKLRIGRSERVPLDLLFEGMLRREEGVKLQLNSRYKDRTYFVEIGDEVEGYKVIEYVADDPRGPTLKLTRGTITLELVRGRPEMTPEWRLTLVSLLDGEVFRDIRRDSIVSMRGVDYKVIDTDGMKATVRNVETGVESSISTITGAEFELLRPGGRQPARRTQGRPQTFEEDLPRLRPSTGGGI